MTRPIETVGTVALVLLLTLNGALAATSTYTATSGATFQTDSGLAVQLTTDEQIASGNPFNSSRAVTLQRVRFEGDSGELDVAQFDDSGRTNVTAVDVSGGEATIDPLRASNATTLRDDITAASVTDVTPGKAGDVDLVYSAAADSEVVFETGGNGIVVTDLSTGNALDEASATGGTATVTLPQAQSEAVGLSAGPEQLNIRSVDAPQSLVTTQTGVNVSFFEREGVRVFERESSNGQVSFADLPKTEEFVVRTEADGFFSRRVLIDSVFEQDSVFLLPRNGTDAVNVSLTLSDNSGTFGTESTLQVQRAINTSDSPASQREYVNVAGGIIGESQELRTTLESGVRYRLVVSNDQGQQRQLGSVIPKTDRVYDLEVSQLDFRPETNETGVAINTSVELSGQGGSKTKTLTFQYVDPREDTTGLDLTIHERGTPSNVLTTASPSSNSLPLGTFKFSTTVNGTAANTSYVANYSYARAGEDVSGVTPFAGSRFGIDFPLDAGWQQIFGVGLLLVLAGVFSLGNARIGALIIPGVALLLFQIGLLSGAVSLASIGLAFAVAVAFNLASNSQKVLRP